MHRWVKQYEKETADFNDVWKNFNPKPEEVNRSFIVTNLTEYKQDVLSLTGLGHDFFGACKDETLNKAKFADFNEVLRVIGKAEDRAGTMESYGQKMEEECDKMLRDALKDWDKEKPFKFKRIDKASTWQKSVKNMEKDIKSLTAMYPITGRERG